jgi:uncharacterized protein
MNDVLRQLVELTGVDQELVKTREQLGHYPAMLARMEAAEAAEQHQIDQMETVLKAARHDRTQAEKEVGALREKIQKYLGQQASLKTNKEYQAMTAEVDQTRAKVDDWETRGLEALEREEASESRRKQARLRLEAMQRDHAAERRRIEEQSTEKQERLSRLQAERLRRLETLPEPQRDQYELLNEHFPGMACAPLEGESCGGCHWHLVAQTCQVVRLGHEMIECDHCRRLLYAREDATR